MPFYDNKIAKVYRNSQEFADIRLIWGVRDKGR
jgi:hypothetical protein